MSSQSKFEYLMSTKHNGPVGTRIYNLMARSMYINTILCGFFTWNAYRTDLSWQGLFIDIIITNFFIVFFLFAGTRNDMKVWLPANGELIKFDRKNKMHQKVKNFVGMGTGKMFLYGFFTYGVKYGAMFAGAIYLIFNVIMGVDPSVPNDVAIILFFKLVWVTAMTDELCRKGGYAGAIDPESIK